MIKPLMIYPKYTSIVLAVFAAIMSAQQSAPKPSPSPSSPTPAPVEIKDKNGDKAAKSRAEAENKPVQTSKGSIEILSDTLGVDFGPYLKRLKEQVQQHWYRLIPQSAFPPEKKSGQVTLSFSILRDGKVAGLKIDEGSGDVALDRAAYGAVTASTPLPPLPQNFAGEYLMVRTHFFYNPPPEAQQPPPQSTEKTEKPKPEPAKSPAPR